MADTQVPDNGAIARELIRDGILRLERDRAAGKVSFLGAIEEEDHILVIRDGKDPDELERISRVCTDEACIAFVTVPSVPDLCLNGPPDSFRITPVMTRSVLQLAARVSRDRNMLGVVLPGYWVVAHYNGKQDESLLQIGVRSPVDNDRLASIAVDWSQALERDFSLLIRGQDVDITTSSKEDKILANLPPSPASALPDAIAAMAQSLHTLVQALWAWHPGAVLPTGICVFTEAGSDTPAQSIRFDDSRLTAIYVYGPLAEKDAQ